MTFCTCGKSKNQPFCDGSHAGTGFKPKEFWPRKRRRLPVPL
ncbi:CDGSH iron-sulfur domain-containing protein [Vibrio lentus]|nr:CDGSH iron-sulfur domain-containing protein [Vibrio lentus]